MFKNKLYILKMYTYIIKCIGGHLKEDTRLQKHNRFLVSYRVTSQLKMKINLLLIRITMATNFTLMTWYIDHHISLALCVTCWRKFHLSYK